MAALRQATVVTKTHYLGEKMRKHALLGLLISRSILLAGCSQVPDEPAAAFAMSATEAQAPECAETCPLHDLLKPASNGEDAWDIALGDGEMGMPPNPPRRSRQTDLDQPFAAIIEIAHFRVRIDGYDGFDYLEATRVTRTVLQGGAWFVQETIYYQAMRVRGLNPYPEDEMLIAVPTIPGTF